MADGILQQRPGRTSVRERLGVGRHPVPGDADCNVSGCRVSRASDPLLGRGRDNRCCIRADPVEADPEPDQARAWFKMHRDIAPRFFVEFLARYGTSAGTIYITALVAGVTSAGAFRAGQVLLGPINLFNIGLTGVAVYEAVRLRDQPRRMQRMVMLL